MPISQIGDYAESHWTDVLEILKSAISNVGFEPNLVSNANESTFIHKTIVQNLFDNPIVVCDVSGKNPNVMFELGLRLAFDKPTIVIKDDATTYSFDTSPVEHLGYPRDLRFSRVVAFKTKLSEKISATFQKAKDDRNYSTFLKHFGKFTVAKLDEKEVSGQEYIFEELRAIRRDLSSLERVSTDPSRRISRIRLGFPASDLNEKGIETFKNISLHEKSVHNFEIEEIDGNRQIYLTLVGRDLKSESEKLESVFTHLRSADEFRA